jgi:hypothetical protein
MRALMGNIFMTGKFYSIFLIFSNFCWKYVPLLLIYNELWAELHVDLHGKCLLFLSDVNRNWNVSTNWLNLWNWTFIAKQPVPHLLKDFPPFHGSRRFITVFTIALHWSIRLARSIHSIPSHPISLRYILFLNSYLRLGLSSAYFILDFPPKSYNSYLLFPMRATCHAHLILLNLMILVVLGEKHMWIYLRNSVSNIEFNKNPYTSECSWVAMKLWCRLPKIVRRRSWDGSRRIQSCGLFLHASTLFVVVQGSVAPDIGHKSKKNLWNYPSA